MVYYRYAGIKSLPGADGKMPRPFRVDENWNVIYLDEERDEAKLTGRNSGKQNRAGIASWDELDRKRDEELESIRRLGEEKPIQLAELGNSNWNEYEAMRAQGERDGRVLKEAAKAGGNFFRNYGDMRDANTIGADKYFHCKANCEASSLGETGEAVARTISNGREIVDQRIKGDPRSASLADQRANVAGRSAGRRIREGGSGAHQCTAACDHFRPNGLNKRY